MSDIKAEPVAWMLRRKRDGFIRGHSTSQPSPERLKIAEFDGDEWTPLYLHPAPTPQAGEQDDVERHWRERYEVMSLQLRQSDARYMALLKQVADGLSLLKPPPMVLMSAPTPTEQAEQADARDAARYRWLRAGNYPIEFARSVLNDTPHGIDAAIDAAMGEPK